MLGVKVGRMGSLLMIEMRVELVWEKELLASVSCTGIQFWTEYSEGCLVGLKDANGSDLLELRVW